ncbi:MAG: pyridoxal-phosphate dependent enzyme [Bacteroidia bacterium]
MQFPVQQLFIDDECQVSVLRLDVPDAINYGNKYYKLRYNIENILSEGNKSFLTFGGAYSNHIVAAAAAARHNNIRCVGIIRGEELNPLSNEHLKYASSSGMELYFVTREEYRKRNDPFYQSALMYKFQADAVIPEGGSNIFAVIGCAEILDDRTDEFDIIICPAGTGGTLAGIASSLKPHQQAVGIAVLNGAEYLSNGVRRLLNESGKDVRNFTITDAYTHGGYGKTTPELLSFMRSFTEKYGIPLDYVYSGKMMYAYHEMHRQGIFDGKKVLLVHTGGYAFEAGRY